MFHFIDFSSDNEAVFLNQIRKLRGVSLNGGKVKRSIHAVAFRDVAAKTRLASAEVNDVRVGASDDIFAIARCKPITAFSDELAEQVDRARRFH